MNTQVNQTTHRTPAGASAYRIISDNTELPRGDYITVLPGVPVKTGDLIMFQIGDRRGIGRWHPNVGGFDWIRQPSQLICIIGEVSFRIIGLAVYCPPLNICATGTIKASPAPGN
ncbi:MAG: hypothetical protein MOB07_26185 [Acidobacteria bacterium]|nr:hypothetical protein [Acidobacteriota bacterium]